jgi:mannose/fructose/N-acetylgalactosamine-specific phosphotransferase system component IIB
MAIVLVRIDDRLIHGQVVMSWSKSLNASVIVIPDDAAAADPMQKTAMKAATPIGMRSAILGIADAAELLKGPKIKNDRVFVVARSPASVVGLLNAGVEFKKVIIGNMRTDEGKKRVTKEMAAGQEDWNNFKELDARGIDLVVQWVPGGETKNFNEVLKKQDFNSL